jgi:hypothetical protein
MAPPCGADWALQVAPLGYRCPVLFHRHRSPAERQNDDHLQQGTDVYYVTRQLGHAIIELTVSTGGALLLAGCLQTDERRWYDRDALDDC